MADVWLLNEFPHEIKSLLNWSMLKFLTAYNFITVSAFIINSVVTYFNIGVFVPNQCSNLL